MAPGDLCLVYSDSPPWVLEGKGRVQKASVLLPWTTTSSVPSVSFSSMWRASRAGATSGVHRLCLMVMMLKALDVLLGPHGQSVCGPPPCEALRTLLLLTLWPRTSWKRLPAPSVCPGPKLGTACVVGSWQGTPPPFSGVCPVPCEPPWSPSTFFPWKEFSLLLRPRSTLSISSSSLGTRVTWIPEATQLRHPRGGWGCLPPRVS